MHAIVHLVIGILAAIALSLPFPSFLIFVLASVFIDLDHFLEWKQMSKVFRKKKYLFNVEKYRKDINYATLQKSLHPFHTFEVIGVIILLGAYNPFLFIVGIAFALHLLLDAIGNIWDRNIKHRGKTGWLKYWFLTYYIAKFDVYNRENLRKS